MKTWTTSWQCQIAQLRRALLVLGACALWGGAAHANFVNGDFEEGTFNSWTVTPAYNPGIAHLPATSEQDLGLQTATSATGVTDVQTVPAGQVATDPNTAGGLSYPRFGNSVARINFGGENNSAYIVRQTALMTANDKDPLDGKIHVRFAMAPVLENPTGHSDSDQPYFFVQVKNLTKGTTLYTTFNFANQPGIPWQKGIITSSGEQALYTDWQAADIAPGPGMLDVNDQVELTVIAAGCSLGGHWGYLYLDAVGTSLAGLSIETQGKTTVDPEDTITYTYTYKNTSGVSAGNTVINATTPVTGNNKNTTYVSHIPPAGANCTPPTVGSAGVLECNLGTLADKKTGTFTMTVKVPADASTTSPTNVVNNGNYTIASTTVSSVLGPLWQTTVLPKGTPTTDLQIAITDGMSAVSPSAALRYTVTVTNNGPTDVTGATLSQPTASGLTVNSWTCNAPDAAKASCGAISGNGAVADKVDLKVGGRLLYTVEATASSTDAQASLSVKIDAPAAVADFNLANNQSTDTDNIGVVYKLTATKAGAGNGIVSSSLTGIACDSNCTSAAMEVLDKTSVTLSAAPDAQSTFTGWSGACNGTGNCTVAINSADASVTATFARAAGPGTNTGNTQAVPTLNQWAIALLGLLLAAVALLRLRQRSN